MPRYLDRVPPPVPTPRVTSHPTPSVVPNARLSSIAGRVVEWGLYLLIVFTPLAFGTVEPWSMAVAELLIFTVAFAWGLEMVALGRLRIERTPLNFCWLLVLGFGVLQVVPLPMPLMYVLSPRAYELYREMAIDDALTSAWHTLSLYPYATKQEVLRLLALALVFWVTVNHLKTRKQVDRIVCLVITMGFFLAVFGIIQHFTWNGKIYWVKGLTFKESAPFGPYVNRNHFAGYMEMVIPVTLGQIFAARWASSSGASDWRSRLLSLGTPEGSRSLLTFFSGLVMMGALLLSGSRAGLFSLLGSMLLMAILLLRRRAGGARRWGLLAPFVALGLVFALWLNAGKLLRTFAIFWVGTGDYSAQSRFVVWKDTMRLGADFLWSGTGLNTFSWAFPLYKRPSLNQLHYLHTENDYLEAFADGGLLLVAILMLALFMGGRQFLKRWSKSQNPHERGLGLGLLAGLAALLIHSVSDFNLHITANAILFVLLLGLATRVLVVGCSREPTW